MSEIDCAPVRLANSDDDLHSGEEIADVESDAPSVDETSVTSPSRRKALRPDGWTVAAAVLGSLLLLCAAQIVEARPSLPGILTFLSVFGPIFVLAWLAGLLFASAIGRWFCIAWALLAAYLFIDIGIGLNLAEARGGIRCGTAAMPAMFWIVGLPFVLIFIAYRSAKRRKVSVGDAST